MAKRRKKKKNKNKNKRSPAQTSHSLTIAELSIAKGHDGLFRGSPEPVIVAGLFVTDARSPHGRTCLRGLWQFANPKVIPSDVKVLGAPALTGTASVDFSFTAILLVVALEQDSGAFVAEVLAAMDDISRWAVWSEADVIPHPLHLHELPPAMMTQRVRLQLDGAFVDQCSHADDFIDARVIALTGADKLKRDFRLHFRSADGLNDWSVELALRV